MARAARKYNACRRSRSSSKRSSLVLMKIAAAEPLAGRQLSRVRVPTRIVDLKRDEAVSGRCRASPDGHRPVPRKVLSNTSRRWRAARALARAAPAIPAGAEIGRLEAAVNDHPKVTPIDHLKLPPRVCG
jgi:hypothetical protein